ncbi:TrbI/VirB10 family protein [Bacteriovorax sp. PP10]|uniref:TrbI/VirB10 family protein n=1 Tax=Bacteriovorax antarcticus TaxID=3088717 RepID=A0ABU5W1E4_9BACT|nr:TrbI/VirB10 family protein [Bacteriovorax sp. PP10]MEA9358448.1 TrbI/VirB10 family protein [Bacteriovorax sp. PP10]
MLILLSLLISVGDSYAKITLKEDKLAQIRPIQNARRKKVVHSKADDLLKKIHDQNEKLNALLNSQETRPVIWDGSKKIETTKIYKGLLLNSIVSTNLESPLIVQVFAGQELPTGTKFACKGVTNNKRVLAYCDRMITPTKEVVVKVQVLNTDGTAGLRGEYNDGKDSYIAGAVVSSFGKGLLTASTSKLATPLGAFNEINDKNKVLEGLASSAQTSSDVLLDEMKSQEPKVFIEAGKPVLIYFMEGLDAY